MQHIMDRLLAHTTLDSKTPLCPLLEIPLELFESIIAHIDSSSALQPSALQQRPFPNRCRLEKNNGADISARLQQTQDG